MKVPAVGSTSWPISMTPDTPHSFEIVHGRAPTVVIFARPPGEASSAVAPVVVVVVAAVAVNIFKVAMVVNAVEQAWEEEKG